MFNFVANVLFCEQVREEVSGQSSFIGVYDKDLLVINEPEDVLPLFTVVVKFRFDDNFDASITHYVKIVKFDGEDNIEEIDSEELDLTSFRDKALNNLMVVTQINHLAVKTGDTLAVVVKANDKFFVLDVCAVLKRS